MTILDTLTERQRALALAGFFTMLSAIVVLVFPAKYFMTNDDIGMMLALSGKFLSPTPDPHVMFINYFLASGLAFLYGMHPEFNFYSALHVAVVLGSLFAIAYVVLRFNKANPLIVGVLTISLITPFLLHIQFTLTAFVCAVAGYMIVISAGGRCDHPKEEKFFYLISLGFLVVSLTIRKDSCFLASALFLPLMVFRFRQLAAWIKIYLVSFVVIAVTLLSFHNLMYRGEWSEFLELQKNATALTDYRNITFGENKEYFEKLGWGYADFLTLSYWGYIDENIFPSEKIAEVVRHAKRIQTDTHREHFDKVLRDKFAKYYIFCALTGLFLIIPFVIHDKKTYLKIVAVILFLAAAFLTMIYNGRVVNRLSLCLACYAPLALLTILEYQRQPALGRKLACFAVLVPFTCLYSLYLLEVAQLAGKTASLNQDLRKIGSALKSDRHMVLIWGFATPYENILPFEDYDYLSKYKGIWLSGGNRSPLQKQQLASLGIKDPFAHLIQDKSSLLAIDEQHMFILSQYYTRHYGVKIGLMPFVAAGQTALYRLTTQPLPKQ